MNSNKNILAKLMANHGMIELEQVEGLHGEDENNEAFEKYKNGEYVLKYNSYYKIIGECNEKDIPLLIADQLEYINNVMHKINVCANIFIFGFICSIIAAIIWFFLFLYSIS